jgi:hypothetical protein
VPELLLLVALHLKAKLLAKITVQCINLKVDLFNYLLSVTNLVLQFQANTSLKHQAVMFTNFRITTLNKTSNTLAIPLHLTVHQVRCTVNVITPSSLRCLRNATDDPIDSQAAPQPKYEH